MPKSTINSLPSPSPSVSFVHTSTSTSSPKPQREDIPSSSCSLEIPVASETTTHVLSPPESYMAEELAANESANEKDVSTTTGSMEDIANPTTSTNDMTLKPSPPPTSKSRGKKRESSDDIEGEMAVAPQAKRARVVGLKNLGNTCYNNAVIQALSHTAPLREYFLDRSVPSVNNAENLSNGASKQEDAAIQVQLHTSRPRTRRAAQLEEEILVPADVYAYHSVPLVSWAFPRGERVNLCNEFSKLLRAMWGADIDDAADVTTTKKRRASSRLASVVSPHAFAGAVATLLPLFQERYEQQDAQEFLRCALERMQEELIMERIETGEGSVDVIREAENTIVKRVFGGILWNKISCLSCNEYTIKPDPFLDLSLVIPDPASLSTTAATSPPTGKPNKLITLEDCIDLFSSSEDLEAIPASDLASRSCTACGSDHGFSKAFTLGELPKVLCIHLKRFRWKRNTTRGSKQKVDTLVKFPLEGLDMTRWLSDHETHNGNALYELYAVVVHQGSGANSGHYTAFVKNRDEWWSLNDERASRVQPEQVLKTKAYLLFYRQQETPSSTAAVSETAESQL
ncbi:hypothetical protein BDD12DRAFT_802855 [Trichophaea hybrida]|nr:hypothetical protein BDD12DRAFT_804044 [Trichophaea hybrida]KAF8542517.1 hypothetical protein BDD12DRAFT_802855 [Trichophaea hybrida]